MSAGTFYLIVAAALIFGAGAFAAKRILRQFTRKQIMVLAPLAVVVVLLIWIFLALSTRKPEEARGPTTQPTPLLQPDRD
jgi:uncharacterized membrane protein YoaK (UPF0700 family)